MLQITIPDIELWDERIGEFVCLNGGTINLEHSLVSLSKWESKWQKPFFGKENKTDVETIDYIRCMTLNENVSPELYKYLSSEHLRQVNEYIGNPMTATTFSNTKKNNSREIVTAELIYYWMIALQIPFECQYWHLNRLLTLVQVCNIKNEPPKKMSKRDVMSRNAALNAARRKQHNTRG